MRPKIPYERIFFGLIATFALFGCFAFTALAGFSSAEDSLAVIRVTFVFDWLLLTRVFSPNLKVCS
jgi:hypothetical protein